MEQFSHSNAPMIRPLKVAGSLLVLALSACLLKVKPVDLEPKDIETSLFLIGDAGEPDPETRRDRARFAVAPQAAAAPSRSIIVFLGDNVYPNGIEEEGRAEYADSRRRLEAQVEAVPRGVRAIFIPGNHDWAGMTAFGLYSVRLQEQMLKSWRPAATSECCREMDVRGLSRSTSGACSSSLSTLSGGCTTTSSAMPSPIVRLRRLSAAVTAALREQVGRKAGWSRYYRGRPPSAHDRRASRWLLWSVGTVPSPRWQQLRTSCLRRTARCVILSRAHSGVMLRSRTRRGTTTICRC